MKRVAAVIVMKGREVLLGRRKDSGGWTVPCGHADEGETMRQAAVRELFEETGIRAKAEDLNEVETLQTKNSKGEPIEVTRFELKVKEKPETTTAGDPDAEVEVWTWERVISWMPGERFHSQGIEEMVMDSQCWD